MPNEIQNFEVERICGIYIPYWLYEVDYMDRQRLTGTVRKFNKTEVRQFYRAAKTHFYKLTVDASLQLSNEISQRLEPYYPNNLVPFESSYLSGFYADCFDTTSESLEPLALKRYKELFDEEVKESVRATNVTLISSKPEAAVTGVSYGLFPAWFLTFRYQNEPYTILVNGQTEKVIGAVPYDKTKMYGTFTALALLAIIVFFPVADFLY